MPQLTLWGRNTSVNVQKAIWALEEVEADYRRIDVGGEFGGLDTPEYGAMNPNRLIPVLQDGSVTVWESSAIVRYLAAQYGAGSLWPNDVITRASSDQWADWCNTTFQPAWLDVYVQLVRTPPSRRDLGRVAASAERANKCFAILDGVLAGQPYLGGDRLTYADILVGSSLYRWERLDVPHIAMPNVDTWHERLRARPGFVKGVEIDFSDNVVTD